MRSANDDRFVPKVHPLDRACEPEDPLEFMAESVPGDPAVMLECVLQEFAWMGYDAEQLLALFHHPGYPVLYQLRERLGDQLIRQRVHELVSKWGVLQFHETLSSVDEDGDLPPLYQIQLRSRGV